MFKRYKINETKLGGTIARVYENIPLVKKIRRRRRVASTLKIVSLLVFTLAFILVSIIAYLLHNVEQIISDSKAGVAEIENAFTLFVEGDYDSSFVLAATAKSRFDSNTKNSESKNKVFPFNKISVLNNEIKNLEKFNSSLSIIADILVSASGIGRSFDDFLSSDDSMPIWQKLYSSVPILRELDSRLEKAKDSFLDIGGDSLLIRAVTVKNIYKELDASQIELKKLITSSELVPLLLGYPDNKNYLLVLTDNSAFRPHGGYFKYIALANLKDGLIKNLAIDSPRTIDNLALDSYYSSPPDELLPYLDNNNWYLDDVNYSPHWPVVANQLMHMYVGRIAGRDSLYSAFPKGIYSPELIDGVFSVSLDTIGDLIDVLGPINLDGIDYDSNLFLSTLENNKNQTDVNFSVEFMKRIVFRLQNKIINTDIKDWTLLSELFNKIIEEKSIFAYLRDPDAQSHVKKELLDGTLRQTDSDFLSIVDFSMDNFDNTVSRETEYNLSQEVNGLFSDLKLSYVNLNKDDDAVFKEYLRIYLPLDTELIEYEGFDSDLNVHNELGKTSFGAYLELPPGERKLVTIRYKLPNHLEIIAKNSEYKLYVQKPNLNSYENYTVDLSFVNSIRLYSPKGFNVDKSDNNIVWKPEINTNRYFTVYFY